MTEFATLAQAFGLPAAVVLYAGAKVFLAWRADKSEVGKLHEGWREDLRKNALAAERRTDTMLKTQETLQAQDKRIAALEDRLGERDTDEGTYSGRGHR